MYIALSILLKVDVLNLLPPITLVRMMDMINMQNKLQTDEKKGIILIISNAVEYVRLNLILEGGRLSFSPILNSFIVFSSISIKESKDFKVVISKI